MENFRYKNSPSPYQVLIKNVTGRKLNAVLFGHGKFLNVKNYGSDTGIIIIPSQINVNYVELLSESAFFPFKIRSLRISCEDGSEKISKIKMVVVNKSSKGNFTQCPINISESISDDCEDGKVDVKDLNIKINNNSHICLEIPENSEIVFTMFTNKIKKLYPYILNFKNITNQVKKCRIFGMNKFISQNNFGSDVGIKLNPNQNNVSYMEILQYSCSVPFITNNIKIQCFDNDNQLSQDLYLKDCLNDGIIKEIKSKNYFKENTRINLDIPVELKISGDSYFEFDVMPKTSGIIYFYEKTNKINK